MHVPGTAVVAQAPAVAARESWRFSSLVSGGAWMEVVAASGLLSGCTMWNRCLAQTSELNMAHSDFLATFFCLLSLFHCAAELMKPLPDAVWACSVGGAAAQKSCCSFAIQFVTILRLQQWQPV